MAFSTAGAQSFASSLGQLGQNISADMQRTANTRFKFTQEITPQRDMILIKTMQTLLPNLRKGKRDAMQEHMVKITEDLRARNQHFFDPRNGWFLHTDTTEKDQQDAAIDQMIAEDPEGLAAALIRKKTGLSAGELAKETVISRGETPEEDIAIERRLEAEDITSETTARLEATQEVAATTPANEEKLKQAAFDFQNTKLKTMGSSLSTLKEYILQYKGDAKPLDDVISDQFAGQAIGFDKFLVAFQKTQGKLVISEENKGAALQFVEDTLARKISLEKQLTELPPISSITYDKRFNYIQMSDEEIITVLQPIADSQGTEVKPEDIEAFRKRYATLSPIPGFTEVTP